MSLSSAANRNDYTGNGATSVYAYTFYIASKTDLVVTTATAAGVETTLTVDTDYTVSNVGLATGGNVTLVAGSLTSGYHITIRRVLSVTQPADFVDQGSFYPETHEDAFDRQAMVSMQQQEQIERSVRLPITLPPATFNPVLPAGIATASVYLKTNSTGTGWEITSSIAAGVFYYSSADILGQTAPSGLPTGAAALGYDAVLGAIGMWVPALSRWIVIGAVS